MKTRIDRIAEELSKNFQGLTDTYEMAIALDYAEKEGATFKKRKISTYKYGLQGALKQHLDALVEIGYFLVTIYKNKKTGKRQKIFWSPRTKKAVYGGDNISLAINKEIEELLEHAKVNSDVLQIVTTVLGLPPTTAINVIWDTFTGLNLLVRPRLYNKIFRAIERQDLTDPAYIYYPITYQNKNNAYGLSEDGVAFLRRIP
ncbi:MAG: hypothetical protein M1503_02365 [Thaumarchaeota archaeon]|nr:hypothetical protein [Nitrososphaerota archaeon]MCL5317096.1 hypothetical protein [Nitrososphaerota archaeon]